MEQCLAKDSELGGIGCDNMSVIIVGFLNGKNEKQWYEWMVSRYGSVGPEFEENESRHQKGDDFPSDYNDDDSDESLEIPAENTEEYATDDIDLENQNELTIDDIPPQRRDSNSSVSSVESGNSSRSNSTDSISKTGVDKSEKKNDNKTIGSPTYNQPQSPYDAKSPSDNTDNAPTADETDSPVSPDGNKIKSATFPRTKREIDRSQ
jgi:hypothetical protein